MAAGLTRQVGPSTSTYLSLGLGFTVAVRLAAWGQFGGLIKLLATTTFSSSPCHAAEELGGALRTRLMGPGSSRVLV
jgi:hypothetical protein